MISCALCGNRLWDDGMPGACERCWLDLAYCRLPIMQDELGLGLPLLSIWTYRARVREAILAYKVQRQWCAGAYLVRALLEEQEAETWLADCHCIMPVPSSRWSRLRGRYDLAALAAQQLALHFDLPLVLAPRALGGAWRKQSKLTQQERRQRPQTPAGSAWNCDYFDQKIGRQRRPEPLRVLLVDDIVTTGQSLLACAAHFSRVEWRCLTLASALRPAPLAGQFLKNS